MSGICGVINLSGDVTSVDLLEKMTSAAEWRGMDGTFYWAERNVAFAYQARCVLPESIGEKQPLVSPDKKLILTATARIDNRDELIEYLAAKGYLNHPVITDSSLILAAYSYWGKDCLTHLVGDFAFALWDEENQHLFAARDPMGMRPFYYRYEASRVLFASEVKQILAAPNVPAEIFEPAVGAYLAGPYGSTTWTFYQGISQLAPGHGLLISTSGVKTWQFWEIDPEHQIRYKDENLYYEHFREIFKQAVQSRLRSSRPIGLLLSGGMDSSSIASTIGYLNRNENQNSDSFYIFSHAYEELLDCDERHISQNIVDYYQFKAIDVPADSAWPLSDYPQQSPDRDDPYMWVYRSLFERAIGIAQTHGIGLMLTGDRGDEMVGDWVYDLHGLFRDGQWRTLGSELKAYQKLYKRSLRSIVKREIILPQLSRLNLFKNNQVLSSQDVKISYPDWIDPEFAARIQLSDILSQSMAQGRAKFLNRSKSQRYERVFMLAGYWIAGMRERTLAKFGMEFADPWSDLRLAKFILSIPQYMVNRVTERKHIARRSMEGIIPSQVLQATQKNDSGLLFNRGFVERSRPIILDLINNSQSSRRGFIQKEVLQNTYDNFLQGKLPKHDFWWSLTLEMWLRQYW